MPEEPYAGLTALKLRVMNGNMEKSEKYTVDGLYKLLGWTLSVI
jgi:hypothetical protein